MAWIKVDFEEPDLSHVRLVHTAPRASAGKWAHLLIDQQRNFCDPSYVDYAGRPSFGSAETQKIAEHNATIVEEFRRAGIPNYFVFYYGSGPGEYDHTTEEGGLHCVEWLPGDPEPVRKHRNSVFTVPDFELVLKLAGIRNLLISGFNTRACVYQSARDAKDCEFEVFLMTDCTGDDNRAGQGVTEHYIKKMFNSGIHITTSEQVLASLGDLSPS